MSVVRAVNDLVRFLLELCAVAAAGYWGFGIADGVFAWLLGIGAPVLIIALWGALVSPKAEARLPDPPRLIIELGSSPRLPWVWRRSGRRCLAHCSRSRPR
ncbi:MAG TPA: YrdB family protein [Dehalococcoidia bacterium]|nr:YrdB family protein [Dehalococcoidia bacterium]